MELTILAAAFLVAITAAIFPLRAAARAVPARTDR